MANRDELSFLEAGHFTKLLTAVPRYILNSRFANTISTAHSNISAHYDISNEMFQGSVLMPRRRNADAFD
jgi:cyclopropane-fatty-acyl-phospholipid synthase